MRLIDADALEQAYDDKYTLGDCGRRERDDVAYALRYAPTVEPASPWHRVEDELPMYGQDVLAARLYGADADGWAYEIIIAHTCNIRDSVYWNATNITHWMPLPEPPKIEGDA